MSKTRATNNRTITVAEDEKPLLRSFITLPDQINGTELQDTIINADLFDVIDLVPDEVADLIIIDPPYNLTKDFNGITFSARSSDDYESYLRTWFPKVCGKLKPTGCLYLCGDWRNSASIT